MGGLTRLAGLVRARNAVAAEIAALIGRPAQVGHVAEHIASRVFEIALEESAAHRGFDGRFTEGPLAGRTVDIKWSSKQDGLLNLRSDALPDYYLVLTGPRAPASSSRGKTGPWVIDAVYLFEARKLVELLRSRGLKIGIATSVRQQYWTEAEIYPNQRNAQLVLSDQQRELLALFR